MIILNIFCIFFSEFLALDAANNNDPQWIITMNIVAALLNFFVVVLHFMPL